MEVQATALNEREAIMATLRPIDVAVESLADVLTHGVTTMSATTLSSPDWGYAVARGATDCRVPLDDSVVDHVAGYIGRHRAVLTQTDSFLRLAVDDAFLQLAVVDVVHEARVPPEFAYDLRREAASHAHPGYALAARLAAA